MTQIQPMLFMGPEEKKEGLFAAHNTQIKQVSEVWTLLEGPDTYIHAWMAIAHCKTQQKDHSDTSLENSRNLTGLTASQLLFLTALVPSPIPSCLQNCFSRHKSHFRSGLHNHPERTIQSTNSLDPHNGRSFFFSIGSHT